MAKNFSGWRVKKDMSPQRECLYQLLRQKNKNKSTSKHTIVKIQNSRDKEKILNATRREDRLPTKQQSLKSQQASSWQLCLLQVFSKVASKLPLEGEGPNKDVLEMQVLRVFMADYIHPESYTQGHASTKWKLNKRMKSK